MRFFILFWLFLGLSLPAIAEKRLSKKRVEELLEQYFFRMPPSSVYLMSSYDSDDTANLYLDVELQSRWDFRVGFNFGVTDSKSSGIEIDTRSFGGRILSDPLKSWQVQAGFDSYGISNEFKTLTYNTSLLYYIGDLSLYGQGSYQQTKAFDFSEGGAGSDLVITTYVMNLSADYSFLNGFYAGLSYSYYFHSTSATDLDNDLSDLTLTDAAISLAESLTKDITSVFGGFGMDVYFFSLDHSRTTSFIDGSKTGTSSFSFTHQVFQSFSYSLASSYTVSGSDYTAVSGTLGLRYSW